MSGSQQSRRLPPRLFALSPGDLAPKRFAAWLKAVDRCVEAGLRGILLREPQLSDGPRLYLALKLAKAFKPRGGFLAMHDAAHLAAAAGVDAVHLGFRSLPLADVRRWSPAGLTLGLSTHSGDTLDAHEPDYTFYGPVFETPSKLGLKDPVGQEDLRQRCQQSSAPIWALGGIVPANAADVLACGVEGLAVRGAIWQAKRPWKVIPKFADAMGGNLD
ncbi:MAG: thiamine-phosphate pyrophosphorylase [Planctomycetota bacterium]|jgi:thiamine-phosphate pyrophosphorylase